MHTSYEIDRDMFTIELAGKAVSREELLDWDVRDRLGVFVKEPFGALGAGLLTLLAMSAFYDAPARKRRSKALYPDVYLFHVGRPWGFHGQFDFWPDRKEILVPDAIEALRSLNSHGITHLVVPDGASAPTAHRYKEPEAALDRIKQCFAYGPDGIAARADVTIRSCAANVLKNFDNTLNLATMLEAREDGTSAPRSRKGVAAEEDGRIYLALMRERLSELDLGDALNEAARKRWLGALGTGTLVEQLRRIEVTTALGMLA
jgi:hypothetical protein